MIMQGFVLPEWDWDVIILYDVSSRDAEGVLLLMQMAGASDKFLDDAERNLSSGQMDNGVTYTNMDTHQSVIAIGKTSGPWEFWNSFRHETGHCSQFIADSIGIDTKSEEFQYLDGEIYRQSYPVAKMFLCGRCN